MVALLRSSYRGAGVGGTLSLVECESKTRRRHQGAGSQAAPSPVSEHLQSVLISLVEFSAIQTSFQMMER